MIDFEKNTPEKLTLRERAGFNHLVVGLVFIFFGFLAGGGAGTFLYFIIEDGHFAFDFVEIILLIFFVFGLVFTFYGINILFNMGRTVSHYEFDFISKTFQSQTLKTELPFSSISRLHARYFRRRQQNSDSFSHHYEIFLIFNDDSHLHLTTFSNATDFTNFVQTLQQHLNLPLEDLSPLKLSCEGKPLDEPASSESFASSHKPSKNLIEKQLIDGTLFSVRPLFSLSQALGKLFIYGIFVGMFALLFHLTKDAGFGTPTKWIVISLVSLLIGGFVVLVVALMHRREFILTKPGSLEIFIWYDLPFIRKGHSKKISLASENIQCWQISCYDDQFYNLLVMDSPRKDFGILSRAGGRNSYLLPSYDAKQCYMLWHGLSSNLSYQDLVYLREKVLRQIGWHSP